MCSDAGRLGCLALLAAASALAWPALAQSPTYGVGRAPTEAEIKAWDIAIGPDGKELPPGRGTAVEGRVIYAAQCARCHGATGNEGPHEELYGGKGSLTTGRPLRTVGSYWPYATTIWDYINRAMPFERPGSMSPDEVYSMVAYLLYVNGIIGERTDVDRESLPRIEMPNRNGFVPDPRTHGTPRPPQK